MRKRIAKKVSKNKSKLKYSDQQIEKAQKIIDKMRSNEEIKKSESI